MKELFQEPTDEQLTRKFIEGLDNTAFGILYQRYIDKVYRKCFSFTKDKEIAYDLAHDILLKSMINLKAFSQKSRFSTWLYALTNNHCIDYLRKNKNRYQVTAEEMPELLEEIENDCEEEQEIRLSKLGELMDLIPEDDKTILLLKYRDNLSIKQLQDMFHLSASAVKMKLKRARLRIVKKYQEQSE